MADIYFEEISFSDSSKEILIIPNNITSIAEKAFENCSRLTSVTIPNSVTSIGDFAFSDCTELTSVTIADSVASIGRGAFWNCKKLNKICVDSNNPNYSSHEGVLFDKNRKTLLSYPNANGNKYVIPISVTSIGCDAFYGCTGLTSIIIPNSVTSIGDWTFGRTGLTSIIIPNTVTSIGNYAFKSCTGLTSIIIPNSVTSIGYYAFQGCTGLTSVTIGNSTTSIGDYNDCTKLKSIHSRAIIPPTDEHQYGVNFSDIDKTRCILYVPKGSYNRYRVAKEWRNFVNIVEE